MFLIAVSYSDLRLENMIRNHDDAIMQHYKNTIAHILRYHGGEGFDPMMTSDDKGKGVRTLNDVNKEK